jgi:membrane-associated phospholipid phosphatase
MLQAIFLAAAVLWLRKGRAAPRRPLIRSAALLLADLIAIPTILRAKPAITTAELQSLDASSIPGFDRFALQLPAHKRERIRRNSDMVLRLMVALPALLLCQSRFRHTAVRWLPDYIWGHALTYTVYTFSPLGPAFTDKYRPVVYRPEVPDVERMTGNNRNSRYSGHTGNAAFAGVFVARLLTAAAPRFRWPILAMGLLPPLLVGSLRVRAQKHFPSDVLFATVVGAVIAWRLRQQTPSF